MNGTILAGDLGGTRIKLGLAHGGRLLAHTGLPANSQHGLAPRLPVLKDAWLKLLVEAGLRLEDCQGVTIAFPSLIDPSTGRVLAEYGKYPDAPGLDLRAWAKAELALPLAIENDARVALAGEWRHGAGRGCENLVMMTLGTGLGTSAVIQGRLLRGLHGQAGVLGGHTTVRFGGRLCHCGNLGCAEAEASTAFLTELVDRNPEFKRSALEAEPVLDFAAVFKQAANGDACAMRLRDHSLQVWSALAVNLIHSYDPERLILGGGIMASGGAILPVMRDYIGRHAHTPWGQVRIVESELGDAAALSAAEWLLREQFPELSP